MTPLPGALGGSELVAWRLDRSRHATLWDSGEGAFLGGGRWNSKGVRAVYCALDPATAILEIAVHTGFNVLDKAPYVLSEIGIGDPASVRVVVPGEIPESTWLRPGIPSADQQKFGDALLASHAFVVLPSAVSSHSWNLMISPLLAAKFYSLRSQEPFVLDPRLNPTAP